MINKIIQYQMGSRLCGEQDSSKIEINTDIFTNSLKYYDSERDPISNEKVDVFSYKAIFIQRKIYQLQTKNQLIRAATFLTTCAKCPTGVQPILHINSERNIKCSTNYSVVLFAQHLNFSFKAYLDSFRAKGVTLSHRQVFYVLRELVKASHYLSKKRLVVQSFDPCDLYVSSTYQLKIPVQNIVEQLPNQQRVHSNPLQLFKKLPKKQILYLSPEELQKDSHSRQLSGKSLQISRVFSLGILIMQCISMLDSAVTYYNYSNHSMDVIKLNSDIKSVKEKTLAGLLSRMLQIDPRERIKFKEIQHILAQLDQSMFMTYLLIQ